MSLARFAVLGSVIFAIGAGCGEGSEEGQGGAAPITGGMSGAGGLGGTGGLAGSGGQAAIGGMNAAAGMMSVPPTAGTNALPMSGSGGTAGVGGSSGGVGGVGGVSGVGGSPMGGVGGGLPMGGGGSVAPIPVAEGMPTHLPTPKGACPDIESGSITVNVNGASMQWRLWVGSSMGPALVYWHGTGGSSSEAASAMSPAIDAVTLGGGLVAAPEVTSGTGSTTGNLVWYTGDVDFADEVLACAIEQGKVDPARIHVAGYSAGGLQTVYHWYARSGYVASVISYSGGDSFINVAPLQNPSWVPPAIAAHGAEGADWLALDFAVASRTWEQNVVAAGGLAIDCDDGGSHIDVFSRFAVAPSAWQFFMDHPWGVAAPYTTLPSGFPSYCMIVK
jgi:hypothetical protein